MWVSPRNISQKVWNGYSTGDINSVKYEKPKFSVYTDEKNQIKFDPILKKKIQTVCVLVILHDILLWKKLSKRIKTNFPDSKSIIEIYWNEYDERIWDLSKNIRGILLNLKNIDLVEEVEKIISNMRYSSEVKNEVFYIIYNFSISTLEDIVDIWKLLIQFVLKKSS